MVVTSSFSAPPSQQLDDFMRLQLTFAAGSYDFVRPLADGTVKPDGIDLVVLSGMGSAERHYRMGHGDEFDICEFNAAAYLAARDAGFPWTALPVFLHRRFRHGFVFVNPSKGISAPSDLRGKRVGGPTFLAAGNVWMRGILEEHHGVPHRDVIWYVEREDAVAFTPPPGLRYERVPDGVRVERTTAISTRSSSLICRTRSWPATSASLA